MNAEHRKNVFYENILQIFKSNFPVNMMSQKNEKSEQGNSIFIQLLKMQLFLTQHLGGGKVLHLLPFFQKDFFLCPLTAEKRMSHDSHSAYRRVLPWRNEKAPKVGLQWIPPTIDAAQTTMTASSSLFFSVFGQFLTYLMTSPVGT